MSAGDTPAEARDEAARPPGRLAMALAAVGSIALLLAMAADVLAVLGRHAGIPLLGSIEFVQTCVVLAASAAMLGATLAGQHASVHLLTERLSPGARRALERCAAALSALLFAALAAGSAWVAFELWPGQEHSEVLGIPIGPLRIVWCTAALAITLAFARSAVSRRAR